MGNRKYILCIFVLTTIIQLSSSGVVPKQRRDLSGNTKNVVSTATNIIATNLLKGNADLQKNYVFSPIGFSSILAILGEGAEGETLLDIASLLKHPEEKLRVRNAYQNALKPLQGDNPLDAPQFKTWLYIYRNNTVEESYRNVLQNSYFVDVKDIDRIDDWTSFDDKTDLNTSKDEQTDKYLSLKEESKSEPTKPNELSAELSIEEKQSTTSITTDNGENGDNSKDITDFETLKKTKPDESEDETRLIDDQKDASKFDEVVEDRQYVEVPVIEEEILRNKEAAEKEKVSLSEETADKKNEQIDESTIKLDENKDEPDKITIPLKAFDSVAESEEKVLDGRQFGTHNNGEFASAISGNSLVGKRENARETEKKTQSKMLLFNGLYYKGKWATPFQDLGSENVFYISDTEKITTNMMKAKGFYKLTDYKELNCKAIELPYDNERYAMLIILPNERNGLRKLLNEFNQNTLVDIMSKLEEESIDIKMPKFNVDSTCGAEKILAKSGLASMFTSKADFSGITTDQHLHVEELQQHVSVRVDEGSSSSNFLTATNALRSNAQPEKSIAVDRPFLFFVRDVTDNVIIVAGKILSPSMMQE